jgi:N-acetylmuramoyl-L-alanine amidase
MKRLGLVLCALAFCASFSFAQTLSGMKICIDPGHGGYFEVDDRHLVPDPGTDFWESESNFEKALLLRTLLQQKGAIVLLTRETNNYPNNEEPSLAARVEFANSNNVNWFHSIHSNATGIIPNLTTNYTLMLVREMRPGGPASSTGNGLGVPETQGAWDLSRLYLSPNIKTYLRTQRYQSSLDWTFYGGTNGGFSLGVLRGLLMPGELSEGSMHDYYPETRRLMNNSYHKIEAYAILHSFMQYLNMPADQLAIVAGVMTDVASSVPINNCRVRLLPEDRLYYGDAYNNGFYMFDSITPGVHTLRFETPGYKPDSVQINLLAGPPTWLDRSFESLAAPTVVISTPLQGDTLFMPNALISLTFSKVMDTASVRAAFSITPPVLGKLVWNAQRSMVTFDPDTVLALGVAYTLKIDTAAHGASGQGIDGNGDGISGDPYILNFKTRVVDVFPPRIVLATPAVGGILPTMNTPIYITFDEKLDPATVNTANIAVGRVGGGASPRIVEYAENATQGTITVFLSPTSTVPGASYNIRVSGVADTKGNAIATTNQIIWGFTVAPDAYTYTVVDSLYCYNSVWGPPDSGAGSSGYLNTSFVQDARKVPGISGNIGCGKLTIGWDTVATPWLVNLPVTGGPATSFTWRKDHNVLQSYVYGDGSSMQFRFCVADSVDAFPAAPPAHREVSPWYTISWVGWHLVSWDLERDSVGIGTGNGQLEGNLRFFSYQFRRIPGLSAPTSTISLDQLQIATRVVVGVNDNSVAAPDRFTLAQNYPNPFNPTTAISYQLSASSKTKIAIYDMLGREVAVLVDETKQPGSYSVEWNAAGVASGFYVCRMTAGNFVGSKKMMFVK